jgi:hypothetical protein
MVYEIKQPETWPPMTPWACLMHKMVHEVDFFHIYFVSNVQIGI